MKNNPNEKWSRRSFLTTTSRVAGFVLLSPFSSFARGKTWDGPVYIERAFATMGTVVTISAYGEQRAHLLNAITKAFQAIQQVDNLMSVYKENSDVSRISSEAGKKELLVDPGVVDVLTQAERYHRLTGGVFDITIEPLMELWGFRNAERPREAIPSDAQIQAALDAVGFRHLHIDPQRHTVGLAHDHARLDLGGIAVGYSVEQAVQILKLEGVESAFINHSGDCYALGTPPDQDGWKIAIPNPLNEREMVWTGSLRDKAVSTSGNYEKIVILGGRQFGHIIDARTGRPTKIFASTTVIADSAIEADALSTGFYCLAEERRIDLIRKLHGPELIQITTMDNLPTVTRVTANSIH